MRKLVPSALVLFRKRGVREARIRHAEWLQVEGISVATKAPPLCRLTDQTDSQVAGDGDVHFYREDLPDTRRDETHDVCGYRSFV